LRAHSDAPGLRLCQLEDGHKQRLGEPPRHGIAIYH
jgi:hypothetical protein